MKTADTYAIQTGSDCVILKRGSVAIGLFDYSRKTKELYSYRLDMFLTVKDAFLMIDRGYKL